jgi:hypothetical protein
MIKKIERRKKKMTQVETKKGRDEKKSKNFSSGELKNTKPLQKKIQRTCQSGFGA